VLALAFHIGDERFALGCADVIEVVPRVQLRDIPHAPPFIAGMLRYRGAVVPVIDLCMLTRRGQCPERLSSRIILIRYRGRAGGERHLGLLAERVTDTVVLDTDTAVPPGIELPDAPYLGEMYVDHGQLVQLLRVERLLDGPVGDLLAAEADGG
jgi:chemotaxis-related protein WspB